MANPSRKVASNPPGVPAPIRGYYSNCVRVSAGPLLFVAGQGGTDATGATPEDAAAQCAQAPKNIERILAGNGATLAGVGEVTGYVTAMKCLGESTAARGPDF